MNKRLLWLLAIPLIIGIVMILMHNRSTTDPLNNILEKDNYPFNGHYSQNNITISEQEFAEKINKIEQIKKYTDEIKFDIKNESMEIQCKLKNPDELFASIQQLSSFQMWASAFDNQMIVANVTLSADQNNQTTLNIDDIKIGEMSLDPNLLSPLISNSTIVKEIQAIPYGNITFAENSIIFRNQLPQFLQQIQ